MCISMSTKQVKIKFPEELKWVRTIKLNGVVYVNTGFQGNAIILNEMEEM